MIPHLTDETQRTNEETETIYSIKEKMEGDEAVKVWRDWIYKTDKKTYRYIDMLI